MFWRSRKSTGHYLIDWKNYIHFCSRNFPLAEEAITSWTIFSTVPLWQLYDTYQHTEPFHDGGRYHIETSPLTSVCWFEMMRRLTWLPGWLTNSWQAQAGWVAAHNQHIARLVPHNSQIVWLATGRLTGSLNYKTRN